MFTRLIGGLTISAVMVLAFSSVGCNQPSKSDDKKQAKADDKKGTGRRKSPRATRSMTPGGARNTASPRKFAVCAARNMPRS